MQIFPEGQMRYYFVGLPKTGSTALAGLLSRYRARHEFWFGETISHLHGFKNNRISIDELYAFLDKRDSSRNSVYDIATFNFHYMEYLITDKNNKFIFALREPYSWSNSLLNHICFIFNKFGTEDWHDAACKVFFGERYRAADFMSADSICRNIDDLIPGLVRYWAEGVLKVLNNLPDTMLVLNAAHRDRNIEILGEYLGVRNFDMRHREANMARYRVDYVGLNRLLFDQKCSEILPPVRQKLMAIGISDIAAFNSFIYDRHDIQQTRA